MATSIPVYVSKSVVEKALESLVVAAVFVDVVEHSKQVGQPYVGGAWLASQTIGHDAVVTIYTKVEDNSETLADTACKGKLVTQHTNAAQDAALIDAIKQCSR
jgi:hypothetical protein